MGSASNAPAMPRALVVLSQCLLLVLCVVEDSHHRKPCLGSLDLLLGLSGGRQV